MPAALVASELRSLHALVEIVSLCGGLISCPQRPRPLSSLTLHTIISISTYANAEKGGRRRTCSLFLAHDFSLLFLGSRKLGARLLITLLEKLSIEETRVRSRTVFFPFCTKKLAWNFRRTGITRGVVVLYRGTNLASCVLQVLFPSLFTLVATSHFDAESRALPRRSIVGLL